MRSVCFVAGLCLLCWTSLPAQLSGPGSRSTSSVGGNSGHKPKNNDPANNRPWTTTAVPGGSLLNSPGSTALRRQLLERILAAEAQTGEKGGVLVDTRVVLAPKPEAADELEKAEWLEEWIVRRANGKKSVYVVAFAGQGKGRNIGYKLFAKS